MSDKIVQAHEQREHMDYVESRPSHINRKNASQKDFDHAKEQLTEIYGGKRCIVSEFREENPFDYPNNHIESHHVFEWSYANEDDLKKMEVVLRALSPFIHGLYMISQEDILAGKPIPSLWDHPDFKDKPFATVDDARNQWFLSHAYHQQSTKEQIELGYDRIGLHHLPFPDYIQYFVTPKDVLPVKHVDHHNDGLDRKV